MNQIKRNKKGQAVVELALVLPVFLLIIMGIIEFGLLMNSYITVINGAREGARYAAVGYEDYEVENRVDEICNHLNNLNLTVSITPDDMTRSTGQSVTVTVTYQADSIVPFLQGIVPDLYNINAETVMRVE